MNILGIIPARYASTRFPGKPLADILGKPMIQRVYEQATKAFSHVVVATDDERIFKTVESFGGNAIMTSSDHCSGTDRCAEAVVKIQQQKNILFDIVVNVQGDEPFIAPEQLLQLTECFLLPEVQIATLVKPFSNDEDIFNINTPKVVLNKNGEAMYFSRSVIPFIRNAETNERQNKTTYYKHIGLYAYRVSVLLQLAQLPPSSLERAENLEQLRWLENGFRIQTAITHFPTKAVDTPEDLQRLISEKK